MDVGVIGVGAMGRNHVRVYSEMKGVGTVYVYDPVTENAERSREFATICRSLPELLGQVDAVSICVPTRYHFDTAKKVIDAGINCLIEKPITLTVEEGAAAPKNHRGQRAGRGSGPHREVQPHRGGDDKDRTAARLCSHQET